MFPISHLRERAAELAARDDIDMKEVQELAELRNILPQLRAYDDGDTCVRASELASYAAELARGQGSIDTHENDRWSTEFIDWQEAAEDMTMGTFTLRRVTYHVV